MSCYFNCVNNNGVILNDSFRLQKEYQTEICPQISTFKDALFCNDKYNSFKKNKTHRLMDYVLNRPINNIHDFAHTTI